MEQEMEEPDEEAERFASSIDLDDVSELTKRCAGIFPPDSARAESVRISGTMLQSSCSQYEELQASRKELKEAQEACQKLQIALGSTSLVHLLIEAKPRTMVPQMVERVQLCSGPSKQLGVVILSLFSSSFLYGLQDHVEGSDRLARSITDACSHAGRISSSKAVPPPINRSEPVEVPVQIPHTGEFPESLPLWFHGKRRAESWIEDSISLPDEQIIVCDTLLTQRLDLLSGNRLGLAYSTFFNALHQYARDVKRMISGSMCYASWTPAWLRRSKTTVFRRGKDPSTFALFIGGVLPNVRVAKHLPGRALARAVLAEWLVREPGSRKLLLSCMRKAGFDVCGEYVDLVISNKHTKSNIPEKRIISELYHSTQKTAPEDVYVTSVSPSRKRIRDLEPRSGSGKYDHESHPAKYDTEDESDSEVTDEPSRKVTCIEGVLIFKACIRTLRDGHWLNDNIINGFTMMLKNESFLFINCFLFVILSRDGRLAFEHISRWVQADELEACEMVLIPMCQAKHWYLVVLHKETASIQVYNSKTGYGDYAHLTKLLAAWASYLKSKLGLEKWPEKWRVKSEEEKGPQQIGGDDCGPFVCATAYYLSKKMPLSFGPSDMQKIRRKIKKSILVKKPIL